jgi:transposase
MPQPNDLSRSLVALDQNSTIIAVVELSQSSWLVGGVVPGCLALSLLQPELEIVALARHRSGLRAVLSGGA